VQGFLEEMPNKLMRRRVAALRGARSIVQLIDMSLSLRSVRLALHPATGFLRRFPRLNNFLTFEKMPLVLQKRNRKKKFHGWTTLGQDADEMCFCAA
jgi:hypothetical protein